jgi:dTDP-4-dehydrorhamnose 3,5-epimerase
VKVLTTGLPGVLIVEPKVHQDARGFFLETFHTERYAAASIRGPFVQDNHSSSGQGVLRGLHFQVTQPQGRLVRCVRGAIYDVALDVRRDSPTFARWIGVELSEGNKRQLWIPPGFAHGFCVIGGPSEVEYKCTGYYSPDDETGVIWNDPAANVDWPLTTPLLSDKDAALPRLTRERADLPRLPSV